jgi:hypothetical protein
MMDSVQKYNNYINMPLSHILGLLDELLNSLQNLSLLYFFFCII